MKKTLLFLAAIFMMASTAKAKTTETTLWNDTYTSSGVEINSSTVATFKAGDILRVYATVPEGGANFKIVYKTPEGVWPEATIPSLNTQWPWINGGGTYYDITFTSEDITTLSGKYIFVYKGENSTIDKVTHITEATPSGTTNIYTGSHDLGGWSGLALTDAAYITGKLANAKIGDVLQVTYSASEAGVINFCNSSYNNFETENHNVAAASTVTEFEITTISILESIQSNGLVLNGEKAVISSVDLLTYSDSYDAVSVTISSTDGISGIATFSSTKKLDFSGTGITAYYASAVETGKVTLTSTATTWDYCGYIIKGDVGTYTIPVTADASYPAATYLKGQTSEGTVTASTTTTYHYIFAKHNDEIGFYKLTDNHTLGAKKAYLETTEDITPESAGTRGLELDFGDGTTAILPIENDGSSKLNLNEDGVYYTLQGTRVQSPTKGLYILNGKKVLVK